MDYAPNICRPSGLVIEFHVDTRNTGDYWLLFPGPLLHFFLYFLHPKLSSLDSTWALDRSRVTAHPIVNDTEPTTHLTHRMRQWRSGELFYFKNRNSSTLFLANRLILTAECGVGFHYSSAPVFSVVTRTVCHTHSHTRFDSILCRLPLLLCVFMCCAGVEFNLIEV